MKKILMLLSLVVLSGCINAGNHNIFSFRNSIFDVAEGYRISFYDDEDEVFLIDTEMVEENNFKYNEAITVHKGYSVLTTKVYQRDVYGVSGLVRANMNGVLSNPSMPRKFKLNEKLKLIGQVKIDGTVYRLVPDTLDGFAFLIDKDGKFFNRLGEIKGRYLVLLDNELFIYPKDLRLLDVNTNKVEQGKPIEGYDVKYDGVRLDRVWFTYLDYESHGKGSFENISFPNKSGLISINGVNMRILQATDTKLTYMLLK